MNNQKLPVWVPIAAIVAVVLLVVLVGVRALKPEPPQVPPPPPGVAPLTSRPDYTGSYARTHGAHQAPAAPAHP